MLQLTHLSIKEVKKDAKSLKQLKQLCRNATGEQLKVFDEDLVVLCKYNNKIIGMCCIAMKSPESHFKNEEEIEVPYLYNYVCDITQKKKKPSVAIMNFVKELVVNDNLGKEINLDVMSDNSHAIQFFEKNKFVSCGEYVQRINSYVMYTCVL